MDQAVRRLRLFEAQHPGGYGWRLACQVLGWSRSWFQVVLREHRLRSGQGTTNTPALPELGGNQPHVYRSTSDVESNEYGMARSASIALAYLAIARAFCATVLNVYTATGNVPMMRRYRRTVRYITFVMEEVRDLTA